MKVKIGKLVSSAFSQTTHSSLVSMVEITKTSFIVDGWKFSMIEIGNVASIPFMFNLLNWNRSRAKSSAEKSMGSELFFEFRILYIVNIFAEDPTLIILYRFHTTFDGFWPV